jgi:hypothetical protein
MKPEQRDIQERIESYVRGELPEAEAAAFEERYFADEALARLVEAEQLLVQGKSWIGDDPRFSPAAASGVERMPRSYAWAAGLLLAMVLPGLAYSLIKLAQYRSESVELARQLEVLDAPAVTSIRVRLSPLRAAPGERPPWRFALPDDGTAVSLVLPVPVDEQHSGGIQLALYPAGSATPTWAAVAPVAGGTAELVLRRGLLEPGIYRLQMAGPERAGGAVIAEFAFEILPGP